MRVKPADLRGGDCTGPAVLSVFSGAGGLDLGLEAVGFQTVLQADIDPYSCATLQWGRIEAAKRGMPLFSASSVVNADIATLRTNVLRQFVKPGQTIDVLAGGPPCQAFSVFGRRRGRNDPRGTLVFEYLRLLGNLAPEAFVFENVYGLLSIEGGRIFQEVCARLAAPCRGVRYQLSVHRVDAVDHAVPQFRDRIFVIGHRGGRSVNPPPRLTTWQGNDLFENRVPSRTVRDALRTLPPIGHEGTPNHVGRTHSSRIVSRYASLRPGQRDPLTRINKLDLDRPSFTIIVGSDKGGGKGHVHPTEPREVTPRESARMQSFPDWWAFAGTSRHPIRQVGNAVPPLLGAGVGAVLARDVFGLPVGSFGAVVHVLGQEHLFPDRAELEDVEMLWRASDPMAIAA